MKKYKNFLVPIIFVLFVLMGLLCYNHYFIKKRIARSPELIVPKAIAMVVNDLFQKNIEYWQCLQTNGSPENYPFQENSILVACWPLKNPEQAKIISAYRYCLPIVFYFPDFPRNHLVNSAVLAESFQNRACIPIQIKQFTIKSPNVYNMIITFVDENYYYQLREYNSQIEIIHVENLSPPSGPYPKLLLRNGTLWN